MSEDRVGALGLARPAGATSRLILGWVAALSAVGEVVDAFFIEEPVVAVVVGVLFLVGWLLLRRGGWSGVTLVGVLCAIELAGLPFYEREDADAWILQAIFLVLAVVGVLAAVAAATAGRGGAVGLLGRSFRWRAPLRWRRKRQLQESVSAAPADGRGSTGQGRSAGEEDRLRLRSPFDLSAPTKHTSRRL